MKKRLVKIMGILALLLVFALSNCQLGQENRWPRTGVLRGNVFLDIEFPLSALVPKEVEIRGPAREGLSVSTERRVSRSVVPVNSSTPIRRAIIPDDLWQALLALQQDWCQHPPSAAYLTYDPDRYEITIKCDGSTVHLVQRHNRGNKLIGNGLQIDPKFMHGDIPTEIALMDTTKDPQIRP